MQFGLFGEAVARRYSGAVAGIPRVRMFEAWNEPNASFFLFPQRNADGSSHSPKLYREMVNLFAAGVHRVHADNVVVAGATFPFTLNRAGANTIGPYRFMREVLCLSEKLQVIPGCGPPVQFDAWSHHPYTSGDPTHKAGHPDSISLGDMPRMQRLLEVAVRRGRITSPGAVKFWVTEFGWDTAPADPKGVPLGLHARWVSEALYRSWNAGVSLFVWYRLRDGPADGAVQSGLWLRCDGGNRLRQAQEGVAAGVPLPVRRIPCRQARARLGPDPGRREGNRRDRALPQGSLQAAAQAADQLGGHLQGPVQGPAARATCARGSGRRARFRCPSRSSGRPTGP